MDEMKIGGANPLTEALANFDEDQLDALNKFNLLVQQLGGKLARKIAKPGTLGTSWMEGAAYLDVQAPEIVEYIMRKFFGEMGLAEFVAFCASMAGYQAGAARAKGFDLPEDMFEEAGRIFEMGMHVIALNSEHQIRENNIALVPGLPQGGAH